MPLDPPRETSLDTPAGIDDIAEEELSSLDAHWRAANYLAVGQIYLLSNPLLTEPLAREHVKPRLLGHWGTSPGLNLVHTHLNRVVKARDLDAICVWGPGHGRPAVVANSWLEGSYRDSFAVLRPSGRGEANPVLATRSVAVAFRRSRTLPGDGDGSLVCSR